MPISGTYEQVDGHPVVRFERTFRQPVAEVWDAVTAPERLAQWFPTSVQFAALATGEPIEFHFADERYPAMSGEFRDVRASERLAFTWGDDELIFELEEADGGTACRLSFSVVLGSAAKAARDAAGWDQCLDMLAEVTGGNAPPRPSPSDSWQRYYAEYQRRGLPAEAPIPE